MANNLSDVQSNFIFDVQQNFILLKSFTSMFTEEIDFDFFVGISFFWRWSNSGLMKWVWKGSFLFSPMQCFDNWHHLFKSGVKFCEGW